jgi:hypothetical protein
MTRAVLIMSSFGKVRRKNSLTPVRRAESGTEFGALPYSEFNESTTAIPFTTSANGE